LKPRLFHFLTSARVQRARRTVISFPVARKEDDAIVLSRKGHEEVVNWLILLVILIPMLVDAT